jgi:hypothetical protein
VVAKNYKKFKKRKEDININDLEVKVRKEFIKTYRNEELSDGWLNGKTEDEKNELLDKRWSESDDMLGENVKETMYNEVFKSFSNLWDTIIDWSINSGNSHYSVTINIMEYNEMYKGKEFYREFIETFIDMLSDYLKIATYIMIVPEYNKNGKIHLHGIIIVKNVMDYNRNIKNSILSFLKNEMRQGRELDFHQFNETGRPGYDVKVDFLKYFLDVKKWHMYLYKENSKWTKDIPAYICEDVYFRQEWGQLLGGYISGYSILGIDYTPRYLYTDRYIDRIGEQGYDGNNRFILKENIYNLHGIRIIDNIINETLIMDLILNYIQLNNFYIFKNNIYKKVRGYKISYELVGDSKEILFNNFNETVIKFFTENFIAQFKGFDIYYLKKVHFKNLDKLFIRVLNTNTHKIEPKFDVMEFRDGIYSIKYNTFIKRCDIHDLDISTLKYYDKSYNWSRQKYPMNWISNLLKVLKFKGSLKSLHLFIKMNEKGLQVDKTDNLQINSLIIICLFIGGIFQERHDKKKKFLYIYGNTSTGKTTLITRVLMRYLGKNNIGTMTGGGDFQLQDIYGKKIVIMDEFIYESKMKGQLLKLFGGEELLISKKYEKEHKILEVLCGVILSNEMMYEEDPSTQKALKARVEIIKFLETIGEDSNREDLLKEEEAEIILFCNKLYFLMNPKKQKVLKSKIALKLIDGDKK